jgi:hypothetical protein
MSEQYPRGQSWGEKPVHNLLANFQFLPVYVNTIDGFGATLDKPRGAPPQAGPNVENDLILYLDGPSKSVN